MPSYSFALRATFNGVAAEIEADTLDEAIAMARAGSFHELHIDCAEMVDFKILTESDALRDA